MRALARIVRLVLSLRAAVTAFFKHDLALRRADDGVRLVLEERPRPAPPKPRPPTREAKVVAKDAQELALTRQQLTALLDEVPGTRLAMRHLVFVEKALQKKGFRALQKLPSELLERALEQLETLVTNWSPVGLASLRSRMAVAVMEREHIAPGAQVAADAEAETHVLAAVAALADADAPTADAGGRPGEAPARTRSGSEMGSLGTRSDDDVLAAAYAALADTGPAPLDVPEDLAAAYAALGDAAPSEFEMQGDLGSPSARALAREAVRPKATPPASAEIALRELHG